MLARVLSAAVNGIEAFPVEVEVNFGWGDTVVVLIMSISPAAALGEETRRSESKPVVIVGLSNASKRLIMPTNRF
jgi:hypothetical protein